MITESYLKKKIDQNYFNVISNIKNFYIKFFNEVSSD